ncbi:ribosomal protein S8 [Cristinia sonorae]|uniref:Ribosomal protein S8 n=1 Tax=Cristinia sonorae TaxID=1940300 RepID=A0A8K0UEY6_9AGAR|nr:ribosomal protein S8 [Cristinia sonorae]
MPALSAARSSATARYGHLVALASTECSALVTAESTMKFKFKTAMVLPHALCSHVQNAFRARHQRITVPHTVQNLGILSILLRSGFILSVTRGTIEEPSPTAFVAAPEAQRRLWADLKYREDRPVLNKMELISKPSKPIFMTPAEIRGICSGRRAQMVQPLGLGEIAVVKTKSKEHGWVEAREAVALGLGGEVICRAR